MAIRFKTTVPTWAFVALASNVLLMLAVFVVLQREARLLGAARANAQAAQVQSQSQSAQAPTLGPRLQWTYEQWVGQLKREADAAAEKKPQRLSILAGDSITMWFPPELLPPGRIWLNQGISGETSEGLLKRLTLFDRTEPETVFVMIGINDLIRGVADDTILNNQRLIIQDLRSVHPYTQIVVQSILPHSADKATWEGRERLLAIPNQRIRKLNKELAAIAAEQGVEYLDLYPLFADAQGNLPMSFSTDGLHLNSQGYLVWRSGLLLFSQLRLEEPAF
nr:SGNH/GDSL hydrolase family protein [Oscillatoria sp. PCC 10802]